MFIEGERVRLRPCELEDAPVLKRWIDDPEIARLLGGAPYQWSLAAELELVSSWSANDWEHGLNLAIEAMSDADPELIGTVTLRNLNAESRRGEIGILIGERAYWNRGYGTATVRTICRYGFEDLDLHRIGLTVAAHNPRAQRAYEKVGFVVEGRLREDRYVGGRYHDTLVMGLLRTDFEVRETQRQARTA
jgi:RimJ/RimL family protein N-acetyltransferase